MLTQEETNKIMEASKRKPTWAIERFFKCEYGLWEKQEEIAEAVLKDGERKIAVRSCHDSGKTFISARIGLLYLLANPDSLLVSTAPSWTQVRELLWREIRSAYNSAEEIKGLDLGGHLTQTKLEFSEDWFGIGLSTRKSSDAQEIAERMLGFHSKTGKILIIVDEASGVEQAIWGSIDGLMTSAGAQLLAIGNPYRKTGRFARLFKSKGVRKIHIEDTDIPNVQTGEPVIPGLMSPEYPEEMIETYGEDSNLYKIKVKGEFPTEEKDTLIPLSAVESAFKRNLEPKGAKRLGIDVARFGDDLTVFIVRQGNKVIRREQMAGKDTMKVAARALEIMRQENIDPKDVSIDVIGIGAGVVDRLHELEKPVAGIKAGERAEEDERFYNVRAEAYWMVRDWMKGEIDLPDGEEDFYQLCNIKYEYSTRKGGQIKIESKKKMKKRGLKSPNTADALMLTFTGALDHFPEFDDDEEIKPILGGVLDEEF